MAGRERIGGEQPASEAEILKRIILSNTIVKEGKLFFCGPESDEPLNMIAQGERGERGEPGKDGEDGKDGKDGKKPVNGVDYFDGEDGKDGKDGKDGHTPKIGVDFFKPEDGVDGTDGGDGKDGVDGTNGTNGVDGTNGRNGKDGDKGEMPAHRWDGTRIAFQDSDGSWSAYVDLMGASGTNGLNGANGIDGRGGERGMPGPVGKTGPPGVAPTEINYLVEEIMKLKKRLEDAEHRIERTI